jgi:hypothetical protein
LIESVRDEEIKYPDLNIADSFREKMKKFMESSSGSEEDSFCDSYRPSFLDLDNVENLLQFPKLNYAHFESNPKNFEC